MKDYEKKYKEALERAKKYKLKEDLIITQDIFPELKESEDERIRKGLITHCRNIRCVTEEGAEGIAKWIAWLEKVGNIIKEWGDLKVRYIQDDLQEMVELKQTEQGEQKPQRIVSAEAKEALYDKPAWSEEDEKNLLEISCLIGNYRTGDDEYKLDSWLKSLKDRVQPQQEWSMYDETILKALIDHFEYKKEFNEAEDYDIVLWLKSLKPQNRWKPSDEQMDILGQYIKQNNFDGKILTSLYEDLKKLREE